MFRVGLLTQWGDRQATFFFKFILEIGRYNSNPKVLRYYCLGTDTAKIVPATVFLIHKLPIFSNVNIQFTPVEWDVRKGGGLTCHARLNRSPAGAPIGQTVPFIFTEYSTIGLYMIIGISQFPTLVPAV